VTKKQFRELKWKNDKNKADKKLTEKTRCGILMDILFKIDTNIT